MKRREFIQSVLLSSAVIVLPACGRLTSGGTKTGTGGQVMTVNGLIDAADMGLTLTHEHVFADLRTYDEQVRNPLTIDIDEVVEVVLPYLRKIRELGCRTLIDCTATNLGRNPLVIKRLADAGGLHMLTVTGTYVAADGRFTTGYAINDSADQLAQRWIGEWRSGIDGTGIRPGFIKLGVDGGPLTSLEKKIISAGAKTHLETGMTIGVHTGPWREVDSGFNAQSAFGQIDLLEAAGVAPSAWIWIHAQNEKDVSQHPRAAQRGGWVSFDGFRPEQLDRYVSLIRRMRDEGLLHRVLVSQDAGWYTAGEPQGGDFNPFHPVLTVLIPALRENGFTDSEINTLFVSNPAAAFSIGVRRIGV